MQYVQDGYSSFRDDGKNRERLANFVAQIVSEVRTVSGNSTATTLTLTGQMAGPPSPEKGTKIKPIQLPPVTITADEFPTMGWVMKAWGVRAIISPIPNVKADLATMIQQYSRPEISVVYRQTGWEPFDKGKNPVYLHSGGGITKTGNDKSYTVQLPPELSRYDLTCSEDPKECVAATLDLLNITDPTITWPLLAGCITPLYGPVDFAVHLTGRTGSFKSELMSLFQAHYGAEFDSRSLPGSWSSTPSALEALAFMARNAVFVIDDFVPAGTQSQQKTYQSNADKIIRAQGNQSGRARLTDTIALQQTMYPRGIIFSTGEDTPEGHSVRARMLILEIAAGDINTRDLTAAQNNRPFYCGTIAWLAQSLAEKPANLTPRMVQVRQANGGIGHSRTPSMLGRLIATVEDFIKRAQAAGFIGPNQAAVYLSLGQQAILAAGAKQQSYLEDADPCDVFSQAIRSAVATGSGFFRTINGGVPMRPTTLGWAADQSAGSVTTYRAKGTQLGWVNPNANEMYLDVTAGFPIVKKIAGADLALSKQTLFKRLKDSGLVTRTDPTRLRNTIRLTAEGHARQVLCLSLSTILDTQESPGNAPQNPTSSPADGPEYDDDGGDDDDY